MAIRIQYTRLSNFFFFIETMTQWHYSCQKAYLPIWGRVAGPLTMKERQAIAGVRSILGRYKFGNPETRAMYLGTIFHTVGERDVWAALRSIITGPEWQTLRRAFAIIEPRFEKVWRIEQSHLETARWTLERALASARSVRADTDLRALVGSSVLKHPMTVVLLMRPRGLPWTVGGGSANIGSNRCTIEAGDLNKRASRRLNKALMIFFHEALHATDAGKPLDQLVRRRLTPPLATWLLATPLGRRVRSPWVILIEGLLVSLLPRGYIAERYFGAEPESDARRFFPSGTPTASQRSEMRAWRVYAAAAMRDDVRRYVQLKRRIDSDFLDCVIDCYLKFTQEKK